MKHSRIAFYAVAAQVGLISSVEPTDVHDGSTLKLVTVFAMLSCVFIAALFLSLIDTFRGVK